ncbi:MAG TPA: phosphoglycerate kinase [Polyangiaceae bacterium]|jgi:phosphoglycerate kinase
MSNPLQGIRSIRELPIEQKRVFLRVDFNVPLDGSKITDDSRIREALPTIKHALERGARLVCASHLGRPKKGRDMKYTLEPAAARLAELIGQDVALPEDCIGDAAKKVVFDLRAGQACLLENLRFHPEEEKDDEKFCQELAQLADVYVDDAFGSVHRAHASVHGLAKLYKDRGCGFLLEKEIASLGKIVTSPEKPFIAILGGAKVSDKIAVVESLLDRVNMLIIGGAMANTFLAARGKNMQASLVETDKLPLARTLLEKAQEKKVDLVLPVDVVVAGSLDATSGAVVSVDAVPAGQMALDIGPKTVEDFSRRFATAATIFWNGPMGLFEKAPFANGTFSVARAMADSRAFTVVGGGDSAAAVHVAGEAIAKKMKHISTGGGASLELVEGKKLPGIEVLRATGAA